MDAGWQRALDAYLITIEDRSGSIASRRVYASTLQRFLSHVADPAAVSRADVLDFLQTASTSKRNHGKPVSAATKNQRVTIIRSFYTFASGYEINGTPLYTKALPTIGLKRLKVPQQPHSLSHTELERFFSVIPRDTIKGIRDLALYNCAFWLGRRRSELAQMRYGDISQASIQSADGSWREAYVYSYTGKGSRQVKTKEIPEPAYRLIQLYLERSGRLATIQPQDFLWLSVHPSQGRKDGNTTDHLNVDYIAREFHTYATLAHLDNKYSLHSLRHTAARLRFESGSSLQSVQHFLDHASIGTTDTYLRRLLPVSDEGAKLLQERFPDIGKF